MDTQRNKLVVRRFDEVVDGGDPSLLDELCTPDIVNHALAPSRPNGLEGTREFLRARHRDPHDVHRWSQVTVVAENDLVVQYGVRQGEWPRGTFRGFSVPGGPYSRDVAFMYRLVEGRIAERWAVRDDLGLLIQLGALTPG